MDEICVCRKSVKDVDELKLRIGQACIIDQAIDQWQVRLNACVDAKAKHLEENMLHNCQQFVVSF